MRGIKIGTIQCENHSSNTSICLTDIADCDHSITR